MNNYSEAELTAYLIEELAKNRIDDTKEAVEEFVTKKLFEFMIGNISDKQIKDAYQIISKFADVGASDDFRDTFSDFVGGAVGTGFDIVDWADKVINISGKIYSVYKSYPDGNIPVEYLTTIVVDGFDILGEISTCIPLIGSFISFEFELGGILLEKGMEIVSEYKSKQDIMLSWADAMLGSYEPMEIDISEMEIDPQQLQNQMDAIIKQYELMYSNWDVFVLIFGSTGELENARLELYNAYSYYSNVLAAYNELYKAFESASVNGVVYPEHLFENFKRFEYFENEKVVKILDNYNNQKNTSQTQAPAPVDPLVLDLGESGFVTKSVKNGVYFDIGEKYFNSIYF